MDLVSIHPVFNLYNYEWPIYTDYGPYPPAKFVHGSTGGSARRSTRSSPPACVVSGALRRQLGALAGCHVHSSPQSPTACCSTASRSAGNAVVQRAILDKNVVVPEGARSASTPRHDLARGFIVTESGITVVGKGQVIKP